MLQLAHVFQVPQAQEVFRAPTVPVVLPSEKVCKEALRLWGCKGVAVALLARGGIANVMEIVELLGHTGDVSLTDRLAGCCQGDSDLILGTAFTGVIHPFFGKVRTKSFLMEKPNSAISFLHMLCLNINTN